MSRESISPSLTEKKLKKLRDERFVKFRPISLVQEGERKGQPTKVEYCTADLLAYLESNSVEKETDKGGATMSKNGWSEPDKFGRSRYQLAKGFQIIERKVIGGKSYDFIYREEIEKDGRKIRDRRPRVMLAKNRDDAIKEGFRLVVEINERKKNRPKDEIVDKPDITFSQFIPIYLKEVERRKIRSYKNIETILRRILEPRFGKLALKNIRFKHIENYRNERQDYGIADSTIISELSWARALFNVAIRKEVVNVANPFKIEALGLHPTERNRWMRNEEQNRLWPILENSPKPLKDLVVFILNTGMRPKNILNLKWNQILWQERLAFVPAKEHKNKKDAYFAINDTVMEILKRLKAENGGTEYVFVRYDEEGNPKQIKPRWYQRRWNEACKEAGIEDLKFYEMKHTLGTRMAAQGYNAFTIQHVLNHEQITSTQRYVKNVKEANIEALRGMEQVLNGNGKKRRAKLSCSGAVEVLNGVEKRSN